jgi:hypothetical protein
VCVSVYVCVCAQTCMFGSTRVEYGTDNVF